MELLATWPELVGPEYAKVTRPLKIQWPQHSSRHAHNNEYGVSGEGFEPGILLVACSPSAILYFQHECTEICQKLNAYFGYSAISRIKVLQQAMPLNQPSSSPTSEVRLGKAEREKLDNITAHIDNPELEKAIRKLGKGVFAANARKT